MKRLLLLLALGACSTSPGPSHPHGQGDCGAQETREACEQTRGCRYLVPGCAEGDEVALPQAATGCYRDTQCSEGGCTGDATCAEVIVNPCLPNPDGIACDACGELRRVCVKL